jgi:hypothetical protein
MDFTKFDSRAAAEQGRDLHLQNPATAEPIFDGDKPCIVVVRGTESREAQAALAKWRRIKMAQDKKDGKDSGDDEASLEDMHQRLVETAIPLVIGFKNINRGDKPAKAPADVEWFLNLQLINGVEGERSFVEQVVNHATKRSNFLGNA